MEEERSETVLVASERVAELVAQRILSGELTPGTRIKQGDLAAEFAASRIPIREALRILASRGLVTLRANAGAWVTSMSLRDLEISYEMRERVEPILLRDSMRALTADSVRTMLATQEQIELGVGVEDFLRLDRAFHWSSYAGSSAQQLRVTVAQLWDSTQSYRRAYMNLAPSGGGWIINAEHRLLLDAVGRGDPDIATEVLVMHIRRTRLALSSHPEILDGG